MGVGGAVDASYGIRIASSTLTTTGQYGIYAEPTGTSAATGVIAAIATQPKTAAVAYTAATVQGLRVNDATKGAGSTITELYGIRILDQTQGTTNYGITSAVSSGSNKWNIYASGTAANYFAGDVGIGATTSNGKLTIKNPSSSGAQTILRIQSATNTLDLGGLSFNQSTDEFKLEAITSAGFLTFGTGSGGTERMRIDSSGNVGIGTSSPGGLLQVGVPNTSTGSLRAYSSYVNIDAGYQSSGVSGTAAAPSLIWLGDDNTGIWHPASDTLAISTAGSERARIDSSGNVGIGTTNIQERLTVQNNIQITNSASNLSGIYFGTNANPAQRFSYIESDGRSTGYINFNTNALERMRIASTGIVTMSAYGAGTATFSAAGVISSVSDERWKIKDGVPVDPDAMLNKLEPGYWFYNDEKKETFGVDRQLGFYAQNVNFAIGPEAAPEPEEGKPWGYYDRSVLAVTVMSLQKALATIETLTARITALEGA